MPKCPECREPMKDLQTMCDCGWTKTPRGMQDPNHMRCAYMSGGQRCIAGGAVSDNTRGGGPWYCGQHYRVLGDPVKGHKIFEDYRKNGVPRIVRADEMRKAFETRKASGENV